MKPIASIAHRTAARVRLRVPSKRGDNEFFSDLHDWLIKLPGVDDLRINALTASALIIRNETDAAALDSALGSSELFDLDDSAPVHEALLDRATAEIGRLDVALSRATQGGLDVPGSLFLLFLLAAATQIARGQILAPATSLLWYAYEIMRHRAGPPS